MPTYSDVIDVVDLALIDDFGSSVTYSIANDLSDLSGGTGDINYYGTSSDEYLNFASSFISAHASAVSNIYAAILDITAGGLADDYSVSFSNVSNVTLTNTDANSNNTFDAGEDVGDIVFGLVTNSHPEFSSNHARAAFTYADDAGLDKEGDVWINTGHESSTYGSGVNGWNSGAIVAGTGAYETLMHEIGHALGLDHPIDENPDTEIDSQQYTIMSYNGLAGMTDTSSISNSVSPHGLQLFDIAALQAYYGANYGTRSGDTVYDAATAFASSVPSSAFIYTIWDGAGTDIIDASGYSHHALIDLRQGNFSSIGNAVLSTFTADPGTVNGFTYDEGQAANNVAIAYYAVIENAIGTSHDDLITGNAWNNVLFGGDGADKIYGDGVTYDDNAGFNNNDSSRPGPSANANLSGNDVLIGGNGDDILHGGLGNDILHGGYDQGDIDDATTGWSTYWDSAGQFTDYGHSTGVSSNASGVPVPEIAYEDDGFDTADYSELTSAGVSSLGGATFLIDLLVDSDGMSVAKVAGGSVIGTDTLFSIEKIVGTDSADVFAINQSTGGLTLVGGDGADTYSFNNVYLGDVTGLYQIIEHGSSGGDTLHVDAAQSDYVQGASVVVGGVTYFDLSFSTLGGSSFDPYLTIRFDPDSITTGTGGLDEMFLGGEEYGAKGVLDYFSAHPDPVQILSSSIPDLYDKYWHYEFFENGSGGTGGGGGTLPTYDGSGNVISMQVSPIIGGQIVSPSVGKEIDWPFVVTGASQSLSSGEYSSSVTFETYAKEIDFLGGIAPSDVRFVASSTQGAAYLTVYVASLSYSFSVADFETGHTVSGIAGYTSTLHSAIQGADTSSLTSSSANHYSGSYTSSSSLGISSGSVSDTMYFQTIKFGDGTSIDMAGSITFTGTSSSETLYGLDSRSDTIYGLGGADNIYAYGGNDTIIGGTGNDNLYGGLGNDTYTFASGWGSDTIHESLSSGTDAIHFSGIAPTDIRMYTDAYGSLYLVDTATGDTITVDGGVTGSNNSESTIGSYVESVTFDSSYSTTWDLTGGLTLTGSSSSETLYSTAYNDTISGMGGADNLYGNAGNDTLIGGTGNDNLYGGPGNDTYTFASGWGSDTIHESLSSGTDAIRFTGIAPTDIRMYTDAYGSLYLVDTATGDTITVDGGVTGSNNSESTIGSYVESVTFDSSYSTTWDLTGGLTLTGSSSAETLYSTAYNDTISGMGGADNLYGNAGNDTLIGGTGNDNLYGGPGNDTYTFASGWGSDGIHESLSSGTDAIHFSGIAPSDIRMYTDAYGSLYMVDTATGDTITVDGGVTGSNNSESTIGSYVESVTFDSSYSTTWDLTGGLTLTGSSSAETLYSTAYNDTISGMGGADNIYGNAGDDTITGGTGNDNLYGGPGNDTYVFASGWGSDGIHESLSSGTDAIHFSGIAPSDIRMYTDAYGSLYLVDTATGDTITVDAGVTGSNNSESTVGSYVESVTFDSSYSTTWDLTGGLTLTGSSSADTLYSTAHNDVIYGMGGADNIYGNAGDDTITGGAGNDNLYGGPGNDTYTFASGWGSDGIHESLSSGTDTIHFSGIAPTDIRMYTDAYGSLYLVDTSTGDTITVDAGVTGSNNSESTIGSYVESVTFDSSYSTTWDLTGGLTLKGTSSAESLYGTAHDDTISGMGGADNIYGNAGNDTINGGSAAENLYGGPGDDILYGAGGADVLTGGTGADTFLFNAATALGASVTIVDFTSGSGNDKIDIKDVISGYDPDTMAITDWVQITTSGSDSLLKVDIDGSGSGHTWQQIATIFGVTGLTDEAALVASGNLIAH